MCRVYVANKTVRAYPAAARRISIERSRDRRDRSKKVAIIVRTYTKGAKNGKFHQWLVMLGAKERGEERGKKIAWGFSAVAASCVVFGELFA